MENKPEGVNRLEQQRAFVIRCAYWILILAGVFCGVHFLLPALMPFVLAYLVAWALDRPITAAAKKTHIPRGIVSVLAILLFTTLLTGLLTLLGAAVYSWLSEGLTLLPALFERTILPLVQHFFESLEQLAVSIDPVIGSTLGTTVEGTLKILNDAIVTASGKIISGLGAAITGVPGVFMKTLITLIASIFISIDFQRIRRFLLRLVPDSGIAVMHEASSFFGRTVPRCLLSYVAIFLLTFSELWIGLTLIRIPSAGLVAMCIAFLDILPVLGTGTVLIPWAILSMFSGEMGRGAALLVIYLLITVVRHCVEPRLVGRQIRLHPVLTFAGMLLGLRFFGFLGMFGLPLAMAFLRQLHEAGIIRLRVLEDDKVPPAKKKE